MSPRRVGKLEVLGLAVYMNTGRNGSMFFNEDGRRVRVHGNMKWKTLDGHLMRGQQTPPGSRGGQVRHDRSDQESDEDSEDDENSSDTNTDDNEEGDVARAINNSLQNGGGGAARANAGRPPVSTSNAPTAQLVAQTDDEEQRLIAQAIAESLRSAPASSPAVASSAPAAAAATAPQCSICMDNLGHGQNVQALRCGHSFHKRCIQQWLRTSRTCPTCRERA